MLASVCVSKIRKSFSLKEEERNKKSDKTSNKNPRDFEKVFLVFI